MQFASCESFALSLFALSLITELPLVAVHTDVFEDLGVPAFLNRSHELLFGNIRVAIFVWQYVQCVRVCACVRLACVSALARSRERRGCSVIWW